jgi:hypothetical protein
LLYTFRVLLTGIHLMRAGEVVADLRTLAGTVPEAPDYLGVLIDAKGSNEHLRFSSVTDGPPGDRIEADVATLMEALETAHDESSLPENPTAQDALHDIVVRARLGGNK